MVDVAAATLAAGYRFVGVLLRPVVPFFLSSRVARGKEDSQRLGERYGRASVPRPPGRLVWVHAASVGETNAILPLIERLTGIGLAIVFTTTTVTSAAIAAKKLPRGAVHQFAPLDLAPFVGSFLAALAAESRDLRRIRDMADHGAQARRGRRSAGRRQCAPVGALLSRLAAFRRLRRHGVLAHRAVSRPVGGRRRPLCRGSARPMCAPSAT